MVSFQLVRTRISPNFETQQSPRVACRTFTASNILKDEFEFKSQGIAGAEDRRECEIQLGLQGLNGNERKIAFQPNFYLEKYFV